MDERNTQHTTHTHTRRLQMESSDQARWRARAHTVLTRRGRVLRKVREHYLRDDLGCGTLCPIGLAPIQIEELPSMPVSGSDGNANVDSVYLVLDTNVVLKQMDLLEHTVRTKAGEAVGSGPLSRCIILQTVLDEVKHQNLSIFNRLQTLLTSAERQHVMFPNEHHTETYVETMVGETPNDRNDRAIRVATQWFQKHHSHESKIILITNDRLNKNIAKKDGIECSSIEEYVALHVEQYPEMSDLVAAPNLDAQGGDDSARGTGRGGRTAIYTPHLPMSVLAAGIKTGKYYQGAIRMSQYVICSNFFLYFFIFHLFSFVCVLVFWY